MKQGKFLLVSPVHFKRVWFIVPKSGSVTVDWTFTKHKQQVSRAGARTIWEGLVALGFRRVV